MLQKRIIQKKTKHDLLKGDGSYVPSSYLKNCFRACLLKEEQIDTTKKSAIPHACLPLMYDGNVPSKDFNHLSLVRFKDL